MKLFYDFSENLQVFIINVRVKVYADYFKIQKPGWIDWYNKFN